MNGTPDYYLCPFCLTSWLCDGPHIEQKDLPSFCKRIEVLQEDLGEFAAELVLSNSGMGREELAELLESKIKNRKTI
jgi:hypothetical protein